MIYESNRFCTNSKKIRGYKVGKKIGIKNIKVTSKISNFLFYHQNNSRHCRVLKSEKQLKKYDCKLPMSSFCELSINSAMNKTEAKLIKIMAELGYEKQLSSEEEHMYNQTVNSTEEDKFVDDMYRLFVNIPG